MTDLKDADKESRNVIEHAELNKALKSYPSNEHAEIWMPVYIYENSSGLESGREYKKVRLEPAIIVPHKKASYFVVLLSL